MEKILLNSKLEMLNRMKNIYSNTIFNFLFFGVHVPVFVELPFCFNPVDPRKRYTSLSVFARIPRNRYTVLTVYVCMYVCMPVCMYRCMDMCMYVYICIYICMYGCMYVLVCMYVCTFMHIYIYIY